jgi:hypothetical protein
MQRCYLRNIEFDWLKSNGQYFSNENKCTTIMQAFNMRLLNVLITGCVYCRMKPWRYCKGIEIARILTIAHFDILQSLFYSKKRGIVQTRGSHLRYFCTEIQPVHNWLQVFKVLSNNITNIATRLIALVAIQVMPVLQAYSMWATYVISLF